MAQRHANTVARRQAIQVLYQMEIMGERNPEVALSQANPADEVVPGGYAAKLVTTTAQRRYEIDRKIEKFSENWALDRMPVVDRAILRLACCEMMFIDECPISVAINEAVDLAKEFGGEDESPRFVNGVLGRIADDIEAAAKAEVPAE